MDWYRPVSFNELLHLRDTYSGDESKLVFGNTRVQTETKFKQCQYPRLIALTHTSKNCNNSNELLTHCISVLVLHSPVYKQN